MSFELDESDRQFVLLGLALMSLDRPGFADYARAVATKFGGLEMLESFRDSNRDERRSRIDDAFKGIVGKVKDEPKPTPLGELQRMDRIVAMWRGLFEDGRITFKSMISGIELAISDRIKELQ